MCVSRCFPRLVSSLRMSTTNKDIAKAGAQTTHFVNSATPRIIDHEHFRVDSEFTRFTDACLRQKLDPLNTGH